MIPQEPNHELFMRRCFDLANKGKATVSPNPMVGAVLVFDNQIIGEGYHKAFGSDHAEVNAVNSVPADKKKLIPESTLYVSLEPCCFYGKTPACTDLIRRNQIKKVVVSVTDPSPEVNGKGIAILRESGVEVLTGILAKEGEKIIAARRRVVESNRPWITIKFAQTRNGYFAPIPREKSMISGLLSNKLVHKLRAESDAILVGVTTVLIDNPQLTTRAFPGKSPIRVITGNIEKLSPNLNVLDGSTPTWLYHTGPKNDLYFSRKGCQQINLGSYNLQAMFEDLANKGIGKVLAEGGKELLASLFKEELWDEAHVIHGEKTFFNGLPAPAIPGEMVEHQKLGRDDWYTFIRKC